MKRAEIPRYDKLMNPLIQALRELGGSGTIEEIDNKVAELTHLSDEQLEILHDPHKSGRTEVEYQLAWARTYLKKYGILENSGRGVWALTPKGRETDTVNPAVVKRYVNSQPRQPQEVEEAEDIEETSLETTWRDELLNVLLNLSDAAFERLAQRILRESGFIHVEVTGRPNDGGIDGKGIMRLGGLLSFHVYFQCKKYKASVTPSHIRDFRGAMEGRADKGLFITTGKFTKEATKEATRDGAKAIDLVDGDLLVEKLKDLQLGVKAEKIELEKITIDREWFTGI